MKHGLRFDVGTWHHVRCRSEIEGCLPAPTMTSLPNPAPVLMQRLRTVSPAAVVSLMLLGVLFVTSMAAGTTQAAIGDTVDGRYAATGSRGGGSVLKLDVTGRGGTTGDASAVALNITATRSTAPGYVTVYPCGSARPAASTLNFVPGVTVANGIVSEVGSNGEVCIYTSRQTHLVVDVNGYFPANADYVPLNPARLLETRGGNDTVDGRYAATGSRGGGSVLKLDVTGRGGTTGDASAVALNITATRSTAPGYVTVYPCGSARPAASTLNFVPGVTVANGIVSEVGSNGEVCIYTSRQTHLVVDVNGYFPANADFVPLNPARLLETRGGNDTVDGRYAATGSRGGGSVLKLDVTGRGGTTGDASAVALNITATRSTAPGYVTVYPCGSARPAASTLNFVPGVTVANGIVSEVGSNGEVCIYTSRQTHLVVDVNGYFPANADYVPLNPARLLETRGGDDTVPPSAEAASHSLVLLNQLRAASGAGPLVLDPGMTATALGWSQEMARSGFRHSGSGYAENIATHSLSTMSPATAAWTMHDMWVNSAGHLRNMLNPNWTRVGIGFHVDGSGWQATHVFI